MEKEIINAVTRKATGYVTEECVDEMALVGEEMRTVKRKITRKEVPADVSAVKLLIDLKEDEDDLATMSDEELNAERIRLITMLQCD